jgi:hypothetical protein
MDVVYASGPAKDLGRYFSNGDKTPGSTWLDPKDQAQVVEYELTLSDVYKCTYELQNVDGADRVVSTARSE